MIPSCSSFARQLRLVEHKVIMFDEAHAAMIIPCKKVFQSEIINFVQIGNSPTNCFLHQTVQCTPSRW